MEPRSGYFFKAPGVILMCSRAETYELDPPYTALWSTARYSPFKKIWPLKNNGNVTSEGVRGCYLLILIIFKLEKKKLKFMNSAKIYSSYHCQGLRLTWGTRGRAGSPLSPRADDAGGRQDTDLSATSRTSEKVQDSREMCGSFMEKVIPAPLKLFERWLETSQANTGRQWRSPPWAEGSGRHS